MFFFLKYKYFLVFLISLLIGCGKTKTSFQTSSEPLFEIEGFTFAQTQSGKLKWRLKSAKAKIYKSYRYLKDIELELITQKEEVIRIKAKEGKMVISKDKIFLFGVDLERGDGSFLKTKSLLWDLKNKILSGEDKVFYRKESLYIQGKGLEILPEEGILKIKRDVEFKISEKKDS
jgi:LPS export ABC transporter protein LptC